MAPTTARSRRERRGSVPPCCSAGSLVTRWPVTRWPAMRWLAMRRVLLRLVLASPLDRGEQAVADRQKRRHEPVVIPDLLAEGPDRDRVRVAASRVGHPAPPAPPGRSRRSAAAR